MSAPALPAWPDVPACHGWLALDGRGQWRLKGERVEHAGLLAFLNANYASDQAGNWLINNGPQRVYVDIETAPWVVRLQPDGALRTHTGSRTAPVGPVLMDELGRAYLPTTLGAAALDDRDLAEFVAQLRDARSGLGATDEALLGVLAGHDAIPLVWRGHAVCFVPNDDIPARMGFTRKAIEGDVQESLDASGAQTL